MTYFAVQYRYVDDPVALDRERPGHRAFLSAHSPEAVVASGPLIGADTPGALLILRGETMESVAALLDTDPFWVAHLIQERTLTEWNPVIGILA